MQKSSGSVFLRHLGEQVFHMFLNFHSIIGGVPRCLLEFLWMIITIFRSSSMQHLRWSSLRQKMGDSWKLLLTFVTQNFIVDDSETHRSIQIKAIKYSICHLNVNSQQKNPKKHQNNLSDIFKVKNKVNRMASGAFVVNFENILHFILIFCIDFNLINVEPEKSQTINFFSVTERNMLYYGLGKFVGLHVFILFHPT